MKIAYFSPMPNQPTGIADFSEELVPYLKKHMDVDIFTNRDVFASTKLSSTLCVYPYEDFKRMDHTQYDILVYHMGNNIHYHKELASIFFQYSGVLEIHDLALHHFLAELYFLDDEYSKYADVIRYCHGREGMIALDDFFNEKRRALWEDTSTSFPVNKHFIDHAEAVIVHSDYAKQFVKGLAPLIKVENIPLHTLDIVDDLKTLKIESRKKLNIPDNIFVLGSFGFASIAKRIYEILEALAIIKQNGYKFLYYIVGKLEIEIDELLKKYNLTENVIVTGYVNLNEFKDYMGACDICFNLRYPTQGESSATLHRMVGFGKPVLITEIGSFAEYPDDFVIKIPIGEKEIDSIVEAVTYFFKNPENLVTMGKKAIDFAKTYCDIEKNSKLYYEIFKDVVSKKDRHLTDSYADHFADLIDPFRLGRLYTDHLLEKINAE